MSGMTTAPESEPSAREQLAALLAAIDRGELDATATMRARIEGAVVALAITKDEPGLIPNDPLV